MSSSPIHIGYQILRAMRPMQWSKNGLLFAGVAFSQNLDNLHLLARATLGCLLFCALSGAIYIFNDLADIEADRLHPRKRRRPLASGKLGVKTAIVAGTVASVLGLALSFWLAFDFGLIALTYFIITILYSFRFKHVAIVDIILLALGFVLRAIAGVLAIRVAGGPEIALTPWFVICVLFLALFIAICKRRHELTSMESATDHRRVLEEYNPAFLDQMIAVSTTATIISYAMYLIAAPLGPIRESTNYHDLSGLVMIVTFPFVIYGIFRYLYLVYRKNEGGEPETLILKDKALLIDVVLWLALTLFLKAT